MELRGSAADLWTHTLSKIPTVFGRLEYLASLRDSHTGRYDHFGLEQRFGREAAQHAMVNSHTGLFAEWLNFPLDRQKAELGAYFDSREEDRGEIISNWLRLKPFSTWVPASTRSMERALFLSDLDALLDLTRNELGVAAPDQDA